jgi:rubrerythrin
MTGSPVLSMLIDRSQWRRADAFIEKYYDGGYITNNEKAEELSRNRPSGRDILSELGEAVRAFEDSKVFSAAREPHVAALMWLLSLMDEVLFNGVLVDKDSKSTRMSFATEVKEFLTRMCEMCNYNTKVSTDVYEVGAKLKLEEKKTEQIVNYSIEKEWLREPDRTFDRMNDLLNILLMVVYSCKKCGHPR